jgi:hypothetical protein
MRWATVWVIWGCCGAIFLRKHLVALCATLPCAALFLGYSTTMGTNLVSGGNGIN